VVQVAREKKADVHGLGTVEGSKYTAPFGLGRRQRRRYVWCFGWWLTRLGRGSLRGLLSLPVPVRGRMTALVVFVRDFPDHVTQYFTWPTRDEGYDSPTPLLVQARLTRPSFHWGLSDD
jgi:hypothetical protein